ncbi:MAG: hypothetical protein LBI05_02090 [Planctomycetaceae bacterium]|nr:hypothetical protein [Planctomycetaceae bacterium]
MKRTKDGIAMIELDGDPHARKLTRLKDLQFLDDPPRRSLRAKPKTQKRKPPASAKSPLGKGKVALGLAGAAVGGAVLNRFADKVVDKGAEAAARAIEKRRETAGGNSWTQAAKNVK